jgi:transposase
MPKKIELDENFIVEQSQKMSCAEMARLLGVSAVTITTRLKKYGITCCGSRKDIEGMKFGKLKVLEFSEDKAKKRDFFVELYLRLWTKVFVQCC